MSKTYRTRIVTQYLPRELSELHARRNAVCSRGSWEPNAEERETLRRFKAAQAEFRAYLDAWHRVWLASTDEVRAIIEATTEELEREFVPTRVLIG